MWAEAICPRLFLVAVSDPMTGNCAKYLFQVQHWNNGNVYYVGDVTK